MERGAVFSELKPCAHMFSSGTEFECFMYKCESCTRYRNEKCRVLNACYRAMFDKSQFPYDDLLESKYAITCKHYTEEPITRKTNRKQVDGQLNLFDFAEIMDAKE